MISARLIDESRQKRRLATSGLALDRPAAIFALRSVLVRDPDAELRGCAAERLRSADRAALLQCGRAVGDALEGALHDDSPFVREAAARTVGVLREERAEGALRAAIAGDPWWRARRAAVRALARVAEERSHEALFAALDDPFWRVRYAAIQALAPRSSALLPELAKSPRQAAALAYLAALRRGEISSAALSAEPPEPALVLADDAPALFDDDPAVAAARLAAGPIDAPRGPELVAALASSHESLRRVAARLLAARAHLDELAGALGWLDEPRTLYAADTVQKLLRRIPSAQLVERVLADAGSGPGARAWALVEAARARLDVPEEALKKALNEADSNVRRAALRYAAERGEIDSVLEGLADADEIVRADAVEALAGAVDDAAVRALLPAPSQGVLTARALVASLRSLTGRALDPATNAWIEGVLLHATEVPWADVRAEAIALRETRGSLGEAERAAHLADADPWIREAALDARAGALLLATDEDPFVRRAAARTALAFSRSPHVNERALGAEERGAAAVLAAAAKDPWIRAAAARALDARSNEGFELLLELTRDVAPMVRASAADALERSGDVRGRCLRVVEARSAAGEARLAAHAQLVAKPSRTALDALAIDVEQSDFSPPERETLRAMALAYPAEMRAEVPLFRALSSEETAVRAARPRAPSPRVALRPLGNTGLRVAPLGISGAGEMPLACFEAAREAGVNLFFWEPSHRALSTFVARAPRRDELLMVAGSYEADARSIERDVERALRRLRVDALGVMLLFWVRSPARLQEGAQETLERLKKQGKVRAIGFSTHLRDLALSAVSTGAWDVIMCRLSAAHPGVEQAVLPAAAALGTGIIAFSALCYGRLLASSPEMASPALAPGETNTQPAPDVLPVTAADCYRYALSQQGVSVVLSAPRRWRELSENLTVLQTPLLPAADIERLRAHGERVRAGNRAFASLVHRAR